MSSNVTHLLIQADQGDRTAANELFLLVESDLRAIAAARKRAFPGDDCTTLGLVHQAWMRLVGKGKEEWQPGDRRKFFGYISRIIQDLLIEKARKKKFTAMTALDEEQVEDDVPSQLSQWEFFEDLKTKLNEFRAFAPDDAAVFEIRYFFSATFDQIAEMLEKKPTTIKMCFYRAQQWLQRNLKDYRDDA